MRLRRGQDHIAAAAPGQRLHLQQGAQRGAVHEVKRRDLDDQDLPRRHQGRDGRLGARRAGYVQVPAQDHDNKAIPHAGFQLCTWHERRPLAH